MSLTVNLRHLEDQDLEIAGGLTPEKLDIDTHDETMRLEKPLEYDLTVQRVEDGLLVEGRLALPLACHCVRCLKPFQYDLILDPWTAHIPLAGEDAAKIISDCVDLTPYVREDILLEFPQHPLCEQECRGLPSHEGKPKGSGPAEAESETSPWSELNKLKF